MVSSNHAGGLLLISLLHHRLVQTDCFRLNDGLRLNDDFLLIPPPRTPLSSPFDPFPSVVVSEVLALLDSADNLNEPRRSAKRTGFI